jgi:phage shock protein A
MANARASIAAAGAEIKQLQSRIAAFESKLAEAERTIAELRAENAELLSALADCGETIRDTEKARDEAKRAAVWSAKNHAMSHGYGRLTWVVDEYPFVAGIDCLGTDADIYRALKEATGINNQQEVK